jgi:hypothetical protein
MKFDKKTIYQENVPEKQITEAHQNRDGWKCRTGNGRGHVTCNVQCCSVEEVPAKLARGKIVDKCGKWRRTTCHANNSMSVVEDKCKGRAECELTADSKQFNKTTDCNTETTNATSNNFLVATALCKRGILAEKCIGGPNACRDVCVNEVEEKGPCKRKFRKIKVPGDLNDAGGFVKEEYGEPICETRKVCKKYVKKCSKDWSRMVETCTKYMPPPTAPLKGDVMKCETFIYLEPESEDFWRSKQNIKIEKEFHIHRARLSLDAEFPQSGPTINKEFYHKIQVETRNPR